MSNNEQEPIDVSLLLELAAHSPLACHVVHTSSLDLCRPHPSLRCTHAYESMSKPSSQHSTCYCRHATTTTTNRFKNFETVTASMPMPSLHERHWSNLNREQPNAIINM